MCRERERERQQDVDEMEEGFLPVKPVKFAKSRVGH
jgi:hypothetical protein